MSDADPYGDGYARNGGSNRAGYGGYDEGRRQAYRPSADRWEGNAGYGYAGQGAYPPSPYASGSYDGSASDRAYADPAFARSGAALADWRSEGGFRSEETRRPEHRGRGPKDYKRSDERIREDVNDILTEDAHLDATGITVETKDAEVTLSGRVHNRHDKRHAEDLAERVSGVKHVQNNLRVHDSNYNAATATAGSAAPSAGPASASTSATRSTLS
jgi:osmotically-inducible protein OsmY